MPTSSIMKLPTTSSAEEFEKMCADVLNSKYGMNFVPYGRKGQNQHGIDLYTKTANGSYIVVQCKNYSYNKNSYKFRSQIKDDIEQSCNLEIKIEKFIVMTALKRDNKIQNYIFNFNPPFTVDVLFWEDIENELCNNLKLLSKYYPQFRSNNEISYKNRNQIIADLELIKKGVKYLGNNCSLYNLNANKQHYYNMYNICVDIYNAILRLEQKYYRWHLQLKQIKVDTLIDNLISCIPEFFDESLDCTGSSMIITIDNYVKFFSKTENTEKYIGWCNKIIEQIGRI